MSKPETGVQLAVDEDEDDDDENAAFMTTGRPDGKKKRKVHSWARLGKRTWIPVFPFGN